MTIFNVATTVVELIAADTLDEATSELESRVRAAGFEVYESTAFESEDQDYELEASR